MNFIPKFIAGGGDNSPFFQLNEIFVSSNAKLLHRHALHFEGVAR